MNPTTSGWYDDEHTGGYIWYDAQSESWTGFTAPGVAEKAVKVATGSTSTKIFFYGMILLWLADKTLGPQYHRLKDANAAIMLTVLVFTMYTLILVLESVSRRVFLKELEKILAYLEDTPPDRPPVLWLVTREYMAQKAAQKAATK